MTFSPALENSAKDFSSKYACSFDFNAFEASVEEFTFLRPFGGWLDVYRATFDRVYKTALESAATGKVEDLSGEAMLDDFEYTLIRPYLNESEREIKHKPYAGMDRLARLEYLDRLTKEAPSNPVALLAERYRRGEIPLRQMHSAESTQDVSRERSVAIAGCVQALLEVNRGRSALWRAVHPFRNNAERRDAEEMRRSFVEGTADGERRFEEASAAARVTFDGHRRASANLAESMARAREELSRMEKMNEAMRESFRLDGLDAEIQRERSPRIELHQTLAREKQI